MSAHEIIYQIGHAFNIFITFILFRTVFFFFFFFFVFFLFWFFYVNNQILANQKY